MHLAETPWQQSLSGKDELVAGDHIME